MLIETEDEQDLITCEHCGAQYDEVGIRVVEHTDLCESCYEEDTVACEHCNTTIIRDNATLSESGDSYCERCATRHLRNCHSCNEVYHQRTMHDDYEGRSICQYCTDNYYSQCHDCGELDRDSRMTEIGNWRYCANCEDNHSEDDDSAICDYGYKPDPIFHGSDNGLFFGVEVEMDGQDGCKEDAEALKDIMNTYHNEHLYIKNDGSLDNGFECVSHPATLEYHMCHMKWEEMFREAVRRGFRSHQTDTCGLHVHISRKFFGVNETAQDVGIMKLLYLVEKFWTPTLKFSRRTASQLDRWAKRYGLGHDEEPERLLSRAKSDNARYRAVNLLNYHTIEMRLFRGTLRYNTFIATLQLCHLLSTVSNTLSPQEVVALTWEEFILKAVDYNHNELVTYLKERSLWVQEEVIDSEEEV